MPDSKVKLKVDFNSKLNELDNENQTYGCRQCNPDICINNMVENVCAFTRSDNICKKPSRAWKNQYKRLLNSKEGKK